MSVRIPIVADQFYPGDPLELRRTVDEYMSQSGVEAAPDRVVALVAPHAGYIYSGATAGYAFARVRGKKPKRVILLGCSHRYAIEQASVYDSGAFETPLGTFPVDEDLAQALAEELGSFSVDPHMVEHSLEVELPFLWAAVGETPIVPVLFGGPAREWHVKAGEKIASLAGEGDLLLSSTDLSHYLNDARAHKIDKTTTDAILAQDCPAIIAALAANTCSMCGGAAVVAAMAYALARGAKDWSLLDYRTSAETSGDRYRVVGYASIAMENVA